MNNTDMMAVYSLWQHRVSTRQYLSDVQPFNLTPNELERLVVDSFYCEHKASNPVDPYFFRKLQKTIGGMNGVLKATINKHLAERKKEVV